MVSKLTKKPLNRRIGIVMTGPRNTATWRRKRELSLVCVYNKGSSGLVFSHLIMIMLQHTFWALFFVFGRMNLPN